MKTSTPSVIQWELKRSARLLGHAMLKKSIKCKRVGDLRSTPLLEKERPTINRWMIQFFTGYRVDIGYIAQQMDNGYVKCMIMSYPLKAFNIEIALRDEVITDVRGGGRIDNGLCWKRNWRGNIFKKIKN